MTPEQAELVERVAIALYHELQNRELTYLPEEWETIGEDRRLRFRSSAKAAIRAMSGEDDD